MARLKKKYTNWGSIAKDLYNDAGKASQLKAANPGVKRFYKGMNINKPKPAPMAPQISNPTVVASPLAQRTEWWQRTASNPPVTPVTPPSNTQWWQRPITYPNITNPAPATAQRPQSSTRYAPQPYGASWWQYQQQYANQRSREGDIYARRAEAAERRVDTMGRQRATGLTGGFGDVQRTSNILYGPKNTPDYLQHAPVMGQPTGNYWADYARSHGGDPNYTPGMFVYNQDLQGIRTPYQSPTVAARMHTGMQRQADVPRGSGVSQVAGAAGRAVSAFFTDNQSGGRMGVMGRSGLGGRVRNVGRTFREGTEGLVPETARETTPTAATIPQLEITRDDIVKFMPPGATIVEKGGDAFYQFNTGVEVDAVEYLRNRYAAGDTGVYNDVTRGSYPYKDMQMLAYQHDQLRSIASRWLYENPDIMAALENDDLSGLTEEQINLLEYLDIYEAPPPEAVVPPTYDASGGGYWGGGYYPGYGGYRPISSYSPGNYGTYMGLTNWRI